MRRFFARYENGRLVCVGEGPNDSPQTGTGPGEVVITEDEFNALLAEMRAAADAEAAQDEISGEELAAMLGEVL